MLQCGCCGRWKEPEEFQQKHPNPRHNHTCLDCIKEILHHTAPNRTAAKRIAQKRFWRRKVIHSRKEN